VFERFNGLPVHVLVVHAVVVLVPVAAVAVFAIAVRPRWRRTYGPLAALVATGALLAVPVATRSGTWLRGQLNYPAEGFRHGELGERVIWLMVPFWALTVALVLLDRRRASRGITAVVAALAVVSGLAATAQVIRTGDSGAESVWTGRIP
jgi:hypothetical protein